MEMWDYSEGETPIRFSLVSLEPLTPWNEAAAILHALWPLPVHKLHSRSLNTRDFFAHSFTFLTHYPAETKQILQAALHSYPHITAALFTDELAITGPRLLISDVDSTFINEEVIEILARYVGKEAEIREITTAAMRGELDFTASLHQRVKALENLPISIYKDIFSLLSYTPGAQKLVKIARQNNAEFALVSGGFQEIVDMLATDCKITYRLANSLAHRDGKLTGKTTGKIVDAKSKAAALEKWAQQENIDLSLTLAIGDGANDLQMLDKAGYGIAFCAKPLVIKHADAALNFRHLDAVAALCGWEVV